MRRISILLLVLLITITSCVYPQPEIDCSRHGSSTIFIANFDNDEVGSLPAPSTSLHYGPPGASLEVQDGPNTVTVIDSALLGSKSLRIARYSEIDAVVGDVGDAPYSSGVYYIEFEAYGETIPESLISGLSISVKSMTDQSAFELKLYDTTYHLWEEDSFRSLVGAYDPGTPHVIHIELNLDDNTYSICIDEEILASYNPLITPNFGNLHSLKFLAPPTITEAFEMTYVMDEIRITK